MTKWQQMLVLQRARHFPLIIQEHGEKAQTSLGQAIFTLLQGLSSRCMNVKSHIKSCSFTQQNLIHSTPESI